MKFKPIRTEQDHEAALEIIDKLFDKTDAQSTNDLEVWATLVEAYEEDKFPIEPPDPIEALEAAFEQQETPTKVRESIFGGSGHMSEVMNRRRRLSLGMIRRAHEALGLDYDLLVREYPLVEEKRRPTKAIAVKAVRVVPKRAVMRYAMTKARPKREKVSKPRAKR